MVTPKKGDVESVPLNPEGRRVADQLGPVEGRPVRGLRRRRHHAHAGPPAYQLAGRLHAEDRDRRRPADAPAAVCESATPAPTGSRARAVPPAQRSLQGDSVAEWTGGGAGNIDPFTGRGDGPGAQRWGALKVRTTNMRPGWLRRNGVPYSEQTVVTEYFTRFTHPQAGDWFVVTTTVEDPTYLTGRSPPAATSRRKRTGRSSSPLPADCDRSAVTVLSRRSPRGGGWAGAAARGAACGRLDGSRGDRNHKR